MLDPTLKYQLTTLFKDLNEQYLLDAVVAPAHPKRKELLELLNELATCSDHITFRSTDGEELQFTIMRNGENTRIKFRCIPNGNEFSSLVLAILNYDGKGKNLPDKESIRRIKNLKGPISLTTYINLSCLICAEIVQSLNTITIFNEQINHEIVDGGINKLEVIEKRIMELPSVHANDDLFFVGQVNYPTLLNRLEARFGAN